jgi:phosphocarrier protein HPr
MPLTISNRPAAEIQRIAKELVVLNENGLCARPTTEFVRCANTFQSRIVIVRNGKRYSADRIIDVLLANLEQGSTFTLEAEGPDAVRAVGQLERLLAFLKETDDLAANSKDRRYEIND